MKTKFKNKVIFHLSLLFVFCLLPLSRPITVSSEEVVLNPGYIEGAIQVGSESLSYTSIQAKSTSGEVSSTIPQISPDASSVSYSLTVNVPVGSSIDYEVSAYTYSDGWRDVVIFRPQTVTVEESSSSIADFILQDPGFIKVNIEVTGGTLSGPSLLFAWQSSSTSATQYSFTNDPYGVDPASEDLIFPVEPGDDIRVTGWTTLVGGARITLPQRIVNVTPGETVIIDYSITAPETGTIAGNFAFNGAGILDRHKVYVNGTSFLNKYLPADGPYTLTDLPVGSYRIEAQSYFNNGDDWFVYPESSFSPTQTPTVSGGTTTTVDVSLNAAFINGNVSVTGPVTLADVNNAYIVASGGVYGTPTYGGSSRDMINTTTGAYDLIVSEGSWQLSRLYFRFFNSDPDNYLNQTLNFTDNQSLSNPISGTAGETATRNFSFRTGTVTITFRVRGGGVLSAPRLLGTCQNQDEFNQLLSTYYFYSWGSTQSNVEEGRVTFAGMEGSCDITAEATVDGSFTTFGQLTVDIVPGAEQVIDIGGPTLTVKFPEPDFITSNSSITVTGKATDDVEVTSVTVNGIAATVASTGNEADPNEVSFSATIELVGGPTKIVTVATDTSGNTSSDTRTVSLDEGPPVLAFTPADGATTDSVDILVKGTATDDIGIKSITVIGQLVTFQSTNNPNDPNEVSFSDNLILADGPNFIKVVATDAAGQSTSETHEIAVGKEPVEDTTAPLLTVPGDVTAEATGERTLVDIGQATAIDLVDPAPKITNDAPADYPVGTMVVTWTATDEAGNSTKGTQSITVVDVPVDDDSVLSTNGKVTGGGFILDGTVKQSFGFNVQYDDNGNAIMKGQLQFVDHNGKMSFHGNGVSSLIMGDGNMATFTGTGLLNGKAGYSYTVIVVDGGNPGRGKDIFSINITSNSFNYEYSGDLAGGNITVQEVKPKVKKAKTEAKKGKGKKK